MQARFDNSTYNDAWTEASESLESECRIYRTHVQILDLRYGWTKHLALLLGIIGYYVLRPFFGSFSAKESSYKMRWEDIRWIRFLPSQGIKLCGVREEDGRVWLCGFKLSMLSRV